MLVLRLSSQIQHRQSWSWIMIHKDAMTDDDDATPWSIAPSSSSAIISVIAIEWKELKHISFLCSLVRQQPALQPHKCRHTKRVFWIPNSCYRKHHTQSYYLSWLITPVSVLTRSFDFCAVCTQYTRDSTTATRILIETKETNRNSLLARRNELKSKKSKKEKNKYGTLLIPIIELLIALCARVCVSVCKCEHTFLIIIF